MHDWRTEPVPRSKKDMTVLLSTRLCPVMQTLLSLVEYQQSRIEVLEQHVLQLVSTLGDEHTTKEVAESV
jgi:hypothetical protein